MSAAVDTTELEREARELIWKAFGYETYEDEVRRFHDSRARIKIVSCPARTSKSYAAEKDVIPDILLHGARVQFDPDVETQIGWIVAPNYVLAKEFDYFWSDLIDGARRAGFALNISKKTNNGNQGDMEIIVDWGNKPLMVDGQLVPGAGDPVKDIITVKSATNINVLQSEEVNWCILSEAARLQKQVWSKFLSTRVGRAIFPTTPDIEAYWIWEMIQDAANAELQIETFQFTGRANPKYDWERYWLEHMRTEEQLIGSIETRPFDMKKPPAKDNGHDCFDEMVGCNAMKEDGFAEQFGGHWVFHKGRVVPIRATTDKQGRPPHVIDYDPDWIEHATLDISYDYGYSDGTCIQFWFASPSQLFLADSIYRTEMTPDDVVDAVIEKRDYWAHKLQRDNMRIVRRHVGDPQQPAVAECFRRRGLPIWDVDKEAQRSRKAGHLELMSWLMLNPRTGEPRMLIHRRNKSIINEWRSLRRNENVGEDAPSSLRGDDHGYDAARYYVQTRPVSGSEWKKSHREVTDFEKSRRRILRERKKERIATVGRGEYGKNRFGGLIA